MKKILMAVVLASSFTAFAADPAPAGDKPATTKVSKKSKKDAKGEKTDSMKTDEAKPADEGAAKK